MNTIRKLIDVAFEAAQVAANNAISDNPNEWYPCGFAWVTIKPARGPLVTELKALKIGSKGEYGGWVINNPSKNPTQWMVAKVAGAHAFAAVIRTGGFECFVSERTD